MGQGFTVNSVFLTGNLTRDPELRYMPNGNAVVTLGLAVNNRKKVGEEWKDDPCFIDVVAYGKKAEDIGESLNKGQRIMVEGHLQYRSWEKNGEKRSKHEVILDRHEICQRPDKRTSREPGSDDVGDDQVPF